MFLFVVFVLKFSLCHINICPWKCSVSKSLLDLSFSAQNTPLDSTQWFMSNLNCNTRYKLFCTSLLAVLQSGIFSCETDKCQILGHLQPELSFTSANATSQSPKNELPVPSMLFSHLIYCDSWILSTDPFDPNVFLRKLQLKCNLWNVLLKKTTLSLIMSGCSFSKL